MFKLEIFTQNSDKQGSQFWTAGFYRTVKIGFYHSFSRAGKTSFGRPKVNYPSKTYKICLFVQ